MNSTYTTVQGDMWDSIAKKIYDNELGMNALLEANEPYRDVVVFPAGVILNVPDYEAPKVDMLPPWRR